MLPLLCLLLLSLLPLLLLVQLHAHNSVVTASLTGIFSMSLRLMPIVIVVRLLGHDPHAPASFSFTMRPSISTNSTLPPSAIRYGRTCVCHEGWVPNVQMWTWVMHMGSRFAVMKHMAEAVAEIS